MKTYVLMIRDDIDEVNKLPENVDYFLHKRDRFYRLKCTSVDKARKTIDNEFNDGVHFPCIIIEKAAFSKKLYTLIDKEDADKIMKFIDTTKSDLI